MVNQFGEAAERILIHEWAPETHDLATLPAQVEELTGALNCLQNFNFEAVSAFSEILQVIRALSRELELHTRGVQVTGSALTARVEALGQLLNEVNNEVQDQRSQFDSKKAEMQLTLEQATAAALEYCQVAEALEAKVDNSRQGWEQATNELTRQLEGVLNEVMGLSSNRAQLEKSVEELKSLEGKVLNCDRVTTNMAEEIRRIGLNFEDAWCGSNGGKPQGICFSAHQSGTQLGAPCCFVNIHRGSSKGKCARNGGETHSGEPGEHKCTGGRAQGQNAPLGDYA